MQNNRPPFWNYELFKAKLWKESLSSDGQTIPPISTKWTITSHLIENTTTYDVGNPNLVLGQAQKCDRITPVNEIPNFTYKMLLKSVISIYMS
jgi:hypothetical protein